MDKPIFQLTETERIERWTVTDVPGMTDRRGAEFQPSFVKLVYRSGNLVFVEVHGATFRAGRPTSVNYSVENDEVVPDSELGAAPTWVADLVDVSYETPTDVSTTGPVVAGHTAAVVLAATGADTK